MLAILAFAAPLYADSHLQDPNEIVVFDLARVDGNKLVISYQIEDINAPGVPKAADTTPPVGIGLVATQTAGGPAEIIGYEDLSAAFEVYPDAIWDMPEPNRPEYRIGDGHPVAKIGEPGNAGIGEGMGVSSASVCMGRLEGNFVGEVGAVPGPNPGPNADQLITLIYRGKTMIDVTVDVDTHRGGVVGSTLMTNLPQTITIWACWGCPNIGMGDGNGDGDVDPLDVNLLGNAWASDPTKPNWDACADFNKDLDVDPLDVNILGNNWAAGGLGTCP
jgi:hypothetical protein